MHTAVQKGYNAIVDWILSLKAPCLKTGIVTKDMNGDTPIHVAAANGRLELCKSLIDMCDVLGVTGVLENENRDGDTALALASFHGHAHVVRYLVKLMGNKVVQSSIEGCMCMMILCMTSRDPSTFGCLRWKL